MWKTIGEQLAVKNGDLKCLEYNVAYDDTNKLSEVLKIWRDKRTCDVSWRKIITVVEDPPLENKVVVGNIFDFLARPEIKNEYLSSDQLGKVIKLIFNNCCSHSIGHVVIKKPTEIKSITIIIAIYLK